MILYLDSSALVKLFVVEPGSDLVQRAVATAGSVATHLIAYAEVRATFAKAVRMGRVDPAALGTLGLDLERRWAALEVLGVTDPLIRRAGDLAQTHGLRGYDSVHLAAVLALRQMAGVAAEVRFGVFDSHLRDVALVHGLVLIPGP